MIFLGGSNPGTSFINGLETARKANWDDAQQAERLKQQFVQTNLAQGTQDSNIFTQNQKSLLSGNQAAWQNQQGGVNNQIAMNDLWTNRDASTAQRQAIVDQGLAGQRGAEQARAYGAGTQQLQGQNDVLFNGGAAQIGRNQANQSIFQSGTDMYKSQAGMNQQGNEARFQGNIFMPPQVQEMLMAQPENAGLVTQQLRSSGLLGENENIIHLNAEGRAAPFVQLPSGQYVYAPDLLKQRAASGYFGHNYSLQAQQTVGRSGRDNSGKSGTSTSGGANPLVSGDVSAPGNASQAQQTAALTGQQTPVGDTTPWRPASIYMPADAQVWEPGQSYIPFNAPRTQPAASAAQSGVPAGAGLVPNAPVSFTDQAPIDPASRTFAGDQAVQQLRTALGGIEPSPENAATARQQAEKVHDERAKAAWLAQQANTVRDRLKGIPPQSWGLFGPSEGALSEAQLSQIYTGLGPNADEILRAAGRFDIIESLMRHGAASSPYMGM